MFLKSTSLTLCLFLIFVACEKKIEEKEKEVLRTEDLVIPLDTMGEWVKLVMKQKEGVLRGFEIGDNIDSVRLKEKAKIHEDNKEKKYITYTFDVDEDFVDIVYFYNEARKLRSIKVNAVVNGVESFLEDFKKFYDLRYGAGKKINDTLQVWKAVKGYQIKLYKSSKESSATILIE
ncbi:MAG: hypothetical protein OHK0045_06350 [Raineya sp.]